MRKLFEPIDIAPLIVFRIFFGFLLFAETLGAIFTGWVRRTLVEPEFTFSHIGMEWLQPLPGNGMYFYFITMALLGLMVMLGFKYRYSLGAFMTLWAGAYLMQKEAYNNHYYLLLLVCLIMLFLPADRYASLDAKRNPEIKSLVMPRWCSLVMIFQIAIVYFFAVISKLYPQWLDGSYIKILLNDPETNVLSKGLFQSHWFHLFLSWSGIAFDLLIVPLLLWRRTRTIAFIAAIFFHLFNAVVLKIGIFPFFALSFIVFFYPPETIRNLFFRNREQPDIEISKTDNSKTILLYFFLPYFIIQMALPLRHYFIKGDVLWTEEGHRLSWRMMLRQKNGYASFKIVDKKTKASWQYNYYDKLTVKQRGFAVTKPDGIWQLCQRIKKEYAAQGKDVGVYVNVMVSVNNGPFIQYVNPDTDLAAEHWNYFTHNHWILLDDE